MKRGTRLIGLLMIVTLALSVLCPLGSARASVSTSASAMVTMDVATGRVLYSHCADVKRPIASTTKIITAITVIENTDLNETVTVCKEAQGVEGSSIYLAAGEKLSVLDLLYGLMLQSGNDAAVALAHHVSGGVEEFSELCNLTAREIGAVNTHLVNPHGLNHPEHYTTAYDLALITAHALKNPTFKEIVSTKVKNITREDGRYPTRIVNKNKLLSVFEGATGVKTGYTKAAGRCLVASAEREGMEVVSVVLNCGPMFEECSALMTEAFREYSMTTILPPYTHLGKLDTVGALLGGVNVYTKEGFAYPLREGEEHGIYCKIELPKNAVAPLKKGSEIGKIKIFYLNQLLFATKIYTMEEVKKITYKDRLELIIENWLNRS